MTSASSCPTLQRSTSIRGLERAARSLPDPSGSAAPSSAAPVPTRVHALVSLAAWMWQEEWAGGADGGGGAGWLRYARGRAGGPAPCCESRLGAEGVLQGKLPGVTLKLFWGLVPGLLSK